MKRRAYEKYKLDWMIRHGYSLRDLMEELATVQYRDPEDSDQITEPVDKIFEAWEAEFGFNGELWVCYEEFLQAEYRDAGYMKRLLTKAEYQEYLTDMGIAEFLPEACCFAEIRNTHRYGACFEGAGGARDDDAIGVVSIDAWKTDDDNEAGEVLANVILTSAGSIVVDYHNNAVRLIDAVTESIAEACDILKDAWKDYKNSTNIEADEDIGKFYVQYENTVTLTVQDIDDIMVSALEGGITYWCCEAEVIEERRVADWGHEQIARNGVLMLHDAEEDSVYELTRDKFLKGFKLWLENGCDYDGAVNGGTVDTGYIDGARADEIIQYAVFGEIVYG